MSTPYIFTHFTPGEAEKITGLSTPMQRDWRFRGYLPKNVGHARFDVLDLGRMLVMKQLSDRGVGPHHSSTIASVAANGILASSLRWIDAYEGDHEKILGADVSWGEKSLLISRCILDDLHALSGLSKFSIWWANGSHHFSDDLTSAFNSFASFEAEISGPVLILDLQALGSVLLERAGRPLVHIDLSASPDWFSRPIQTELEYGPVIPLNSNRPS